MVKATYYPRTQLTLQADVVGAKMWGVALEQTMLTYFEVQPSCRFEMHQHPSEQITMVLSGTLFFEVNDEVIAVGQGEVIALPCHVEHAVFTREEAVTAVDAWSPILEKYAR